MHKMFSVAALTLTLASCESTHPHDHLVPFVPPTFAPVTEAVDKIPPVPLDVFREIFISGMKK